MPIVTNINVEYKLNKISIDTINYSMVLDVDRGIVENGNFVPLNTLTIAVDQPTTVALMQSAPVGATIYDVLKSSLYQHLLTAGIVTGTIQ